MKIHIPEITISDVTCTEEGLAALVKVFGGGMFNAIPAATQAVEAPQLALPSATVKGSGKPGRKTGHKAQPSPPAEKVTAKKADPEAPRVTIRQRIIDFIRSKGTATAPEVTAELVRQGIATDTALISQHLYLMTRDEVTVRDDETKTWSLVR